MQSVIKAYSPGLLISALIALAVRFISDHLGGPAMLYALLFGIAFNFLSEDERFAAGLGLATRLVLRLGVALLGLRITLVEVTDLGWPVAALVSIGVLATIVEGWGIARACGLRSSYSLLSAGSVAICGASAALAIASVLPSHKNHERDTILTVAVVTTLSTVAMVIYPVLVSSLGLDDRHAGIFLGLTIHDVAQVVGAGYMISPETGETSTLIKLMRVACLVPVVIVISAAARRRRDPSQQRASILPWFLVAFVLFVLLNSFMVAPPDVTDAATAFSSWCLLTAVAALGVKTSPASIIKVGAAPLAAMILQSLFLAAVATCGIYFI